MQILHPFSGSIRQYQEELSDVDRYRPHQCPQCEAKRPLTAHGFYQRTLEDIGFDGIIRVRRYLCQCCQRTVSLLPEFALPYLRASILVIALFLIARLLRVQTLRVAAAQSAYQRGQFWIRRFQWQAEALCGALAGLTAPHSPPTSWPGPCTCWRTSAGSLPTAFCLAICASPAGLATFLAPSGLRAPVSPAARQPEAHTHLLPFEARCVGLIFRRRYISVDDKSEKIALFRFGLIAPLMLETLPRGELTGVLRRLLPATSTSRIPVAPRFRWTRYWTGGSAIAAAVWTRSLPGASGPRAGPRHDTQLPP